MYLIWIISIGQLGCLVHKKGFVKTEVPTTVVVPHEVNIKRREYLVKRKTISVADLLLKTLCVVNHLFSQTLYSHQLLLLL